MALTDKSLSLLKEIYAHHSYGVEDLVSENPDEALEYVLQNIIDRLLDHHHDGAPLHVVTEAAVMGLRYGRSTGLAQKAVQKQ